MRTEEKLIKTKLGLLNLAQQLGNTPNPGAHAVSQACRVMGYSRDSFYRFKQLYAEQGEAGLREVSRRQQNRKNRVAVEVEEAVVHLATENPALGQVRVARSATQATRVVCVSRWSTLNLVTAWPRNIQETPEISGREVRQRRFHLDRSPTPSPRKSQRTT